jgi:hypothetical protein
MAGKLIKIENEYYLTTDTKVEEGDYGLAFAHGGRNGFGRGWYIFYHDGKPVNKLNAICAGTRKITHSTAPIDGDEVGSCFHIIEQLSLKNCEAIERDYDLGELKNQHIQEQLSNFDKESYERYLPFAEDEANIFIEGFQKALEILGDKKFSEENIEEAFAYGQLNQLHNQKYFSGSAYLQSLLQPTEIDVEIVMEKVVDETKIISAIKGVKGSGDKITTYKTVPKLDSEGCLILKRVV